MLFFQIVNDIIFNGPVDLTAKAHSEYNATYAYVFGYSSANNPAPAYKSKVVYVYKNI